MSNYTPHLPRISTNYKGSETVREYIDQKRESFQEQLTINTKEDKIKEMKTTESSEKKQISEAEKIFEYGAFEFEKFLEKLERNAVEAMKTADRETKARLEKEAEVRRVRADIMAIKRLFFITFCPADNGFTRQEMSDIVKEEETLKEYKRFAKFLYMLSPPDWRETQEQKKMERKATKNKGERRLTGILSALQQEQDSKLRMPLISEDMRQPRPTFHPRSSVSESRKSSTRSSPDVSVEELGTEGSDSEEELELYFTDPQQLIEMIKELEEDTIHLLQTLQEEEDNLEDIKQKGNIKKEKMWAS